MGSNLHPNGYCYRCGAPAIGAKEGMLLCRDHLKTRPIKKTSSRNEIRFRAEVRFISSRAGGRKHWVITYNESDPESIGDTAVAGMPCPAEGVPEGTAYETVLTIPED